MVKENNTVALRDLNEGDRFKFPFENRTRYLSQKGKIEGYCPIEDDYCSAISGEEVYLLSAPVIKLENEQSDSNNKKDPREADILELCKGVLNASPATYYNPNGPDDSTCPFCHKQVQYADADINDIPHDTKCAYLIAKDLSTGLL